MKRLIILAIIITTSSSAFSQKLQEQMFFYNPKGLSFIPPLKRPALVYEGKLYVGKRKLNGLFARIDNPALTLYFKKYKANKTAADILYYAGVGLTIFTAVEWKNNQNFPWAIFVPGFVASGASGYLNLKAQQNLLMSAAYFQQLQATQKATGFVPKQRNISFTIPLNL